MIQVIKVKNPFRPATERELVEVAYFPGMLISAALREASADPDKSIAVIDGEAIRSEEMATRFVPDNATIVVMPNVGGGGFLRTFAEIAVLVAAAVVTYGLSSGGTLGMFFASAGLGNLSGAAVSMIGSAIALGGNLLISAFMSPSMKGGNDTATYDPVGPKTVASGGTPIPKGCGTMRWGGNIIASYVSAEGSDNYINVLVSYGWGPAASISDIRINNTPISDYKDATYQVRLGSNSQTPIPYFNNIVNGYPQAQRCLAGSSVVIQGTGTNTQGLEVTCQFPTGVFYSNDDGSLRSLSIAYKVEYAVSGTSNWVSAIMPRTTHDVVTYNPNGTIKSHPGWVVVPTDSKFSSGIIYAYDNNTSPTAYTPGQPWSGTQTVTYYNADGSSYQGSIFLQGEWQMCDPSLNQQIVDNWYSGYEIFTDANQATLYHTTRIYNLPPNKYDIRITKYGSAFAGDPIQAREANNARTGDQVWIHNINEVQFQDLAYPNMILLGIRALATNQLSGQGMNITALVTHGINATLPAALASYETDNPAVVAYDMMCSDAALYGGGINPSQVDTATLAAWAAFNDELVSDGFTGQIRRHVFNGVFEQQGMSLWKALQQVGNMSQCIPVQIGKNFSFIIDDAVTAPVQIFTVGNIKKDSIKDTWISLDDRANRVEVNFADAARDYRGDEPCAVMTPEDIQAGVTVQTTRVNLLGCTNRAQAWHWAYRKLLATKALTLTRSFDVGVDAVACQIGSVIGVQDDVTQWAEGGRIQAGSTASSLIVDRADLTFAPNAGWTVSVVHPTLSRGTATISTVVGNVLTFTGNLPSGRLMLCVGTSGAQSAVQQYSATTATLESAFGFSAGQVVTLYDQDVIDTQLVSSYSNSTLVPAAPFLQAPAQDAPWVYGLSAGAFPAKLFRVTGIKRKGDFDMTIDCVIYDPSVYADDTPIIAETLAVPDVSAAVTALTLTENYAMANGANGGQTSSISVGWQNGPDTYKTEIWVARNDANQPISREVLLTTVMKGTTFTFPAPTGAIIQVRAVGINVAGVRASWNDAPVQTITVQGAGDAPGDVLAFWGTSNPSGTTLYWLAAYNAANYEIRYNNDINNSNWSSGVLLWSGNALTWADSQMRTGRYMIKALSSASVESINVASYSYLESGARLNLMGLQTGQSVIVNVTRNIYGSGGCSLTLDCPVQSLYRPDGSTAQLSDSTIVWNANLAANTSYVIYTYLRLSDLTIHAALGDGVVPDTGTNPSSAAICSQAGNYPGPVINVTTPSSGSGSTSANLTPVTDYNSDVVPPNTPYYTLTSIQATSGGAGYVNPTARLTGILANGTKLNLADYTVTLTVAGGAITSATPTANALAAQWKYAPGIIISGGS